MPKFVRIPIKALAWLTLATLLTAVGLAAVVILDSRPLPEAQAQITSAERAWINRWIASNRPSASRSGGSHVLSLTEAEANLLLNALVDKIGQGGARLRLAAGEARILASLRLPFDQVKGYLNLEVEVREGSPLPRIESARIAGLPIPGILAQTLAQQTLEAIEQAQILDRVQIERDRVLIRYAWRPDMLEQLGSGLLAETDLPNVLRYQEQLTTLAAAQPRRKPLALGDLLAALLKAAESDRQADPVTANRALILALAAYVNGRVIHDPAKPEVEATRRPRSVQLRGRHDLAQHFMVSAGLAIRGNDTLSSLVGWYKEVSDADGGSGFSFADLTANRAGIRFATLATDSQSSARRLQRLASNGLAEDDFMPPIDALPEGMSRQGFTSRFGDAKTGAYRQMIKTIDRRIAERPLFNL